MVRYDKPVIRVIAVTPEEVTELQNYLIDNNFLSAVKTSITEAYYIQQELSHLWVAIDPIKKLVHGHQTIEGYEGKAREHILAKYFTINGDTMSLRALQHPENYPEYFI